MATNYQFTRVETIFPSRSEAIEKLDSLILPFGTGVVIRYDETLKESCHCGWGDENPSTKIILAAYISDDRSGNYSIVFDSEVNIEDLIDGGLKVYQGTITNGQTAEEAIKATLFGIEPKENNIVILLNKSEGVSESYIYISKKWRCLGKEQAPVQYSPQFNFDEETRDLTIKQIHGGTF